MITTIQHSGCSIRIMLEGRQFLFQWCFYIWKATTSPENFIQARKLQSSSLDPSAFWSTPVLFSDLRIDSDFGINYRLIKNFSQWIGNLPCSVCSAAWCVLLSFMSTIMAHPKWGFPGSVKATTTWINPWVSFIYMISFYLWLDGTEMLKCNGHKSI